MVGVYKIHSKKKNFFSKLSLTTQLILINIITFFIGYFLLALYGEKFLFDYIALKPSLILQGKSLWTFITSMFMHGSFFHIFANMFSLFFIGNFLERIVGKKRFFWTYLIAGLVGGIFFILSALIFGGLDTPAVGASGALFGLLGVLAVLVPHSKVYLIVGPLILIVLEVVFSIFLPETLLSVFTFLINFLILFMIFSLFSFNSAFRKFAVPVELSMWLLPIIAIVPLVIISHFVPLPIGNSAHLGGLVVGLIYGFYLRKKYPNKIKKISNLFR